jgi:regulatory subunit for Cdc7p protein kinase
MATLSRRPLASRPPPLQVPPILSPLKTTRTASCSTKRSRSPDLTGDGNASNTSTKRARAVADPAATATRDKDKERRHTEREQQKTEFKEKYCRAFPTWTFYFDSDNVEVDSAVVKGILELGGVRAVLITSRDNIYSFTPAH